MLRKTYLLSIFFLLFTYQNNKNSRKTHFLEKQNNITKKQVLKKISACYVGNCLKCMQKNLYGEKNIMIMSVLQHLSYGN